MEAVVEFIKKTKQLLAHLEGDFPTDEREKYIDGIHQLLDERSQLLNQVRGLHTLKEEDKEELVKLESKIQCLLADRQKVIKKDLLQLLICISSKILMIC